MKKYAIFFSLHILSVVLWAVWALPAMNESGSFGAEASWIVAQIVLPVLIASLLARRYRPGLYLALVWGAALLLSGAGLTGWSFMGTGTPLSVYIVAGLLLMDGLGIFSSALKDLNWIRDTNNRYAFED